MVTLSSHPSYFNPPSTSQEPLVTYPLPLTLPAIHHLWTEALSLTPTSASLSLTHLQRLLRTTYLLPQPLLTSAQTSPLYLNIALIRAFLGEYFLAAESFQKAIELDPKCAIGWHGLGGMKFLLGDWKEARKAWNKCLVLFKAKNILRYKVWKIGNIGGDAGIKHRDRGWMLERSAVEWNTTFTGSRDKVEREKVDHTVWSVNGIPAGLVFGPSFSVSFGHYHYEKKRDKLGKGSGEETMVTILHHKLPSIPQTSSRTSSPLPEPSITALPPLPAVPGRTLSTNVPILRPQKRLSISRLITRSRTFSASKSRPAKLMQSELPAEPVIFSDVAKPTIALRSEERPSSASAVTKASAILSRKVQIPDSRAVTGQALINECAITDSDSDADALAYYFSSRDGPQSNKERGVHSVGLTTLKSLPSYPQRVSSYNSGRIDRPLIGPRELVESPRVASQKRSGATRKMKEQRRDGTMKLSSDKGEKRGAAGKRYKEAKPRAMSYGAEEKEQKVITSVWRPERKDSLRGKWLKEKDAQPGEHEKRIPPADCHVAERKIMAKAGEEKKQSILASFVDDEETEIKVVVPNRGSAKLKPNIKAHATATKANTTIIDDSKSRKATSHKNRKQQLSTTSSSNSKSLISTQTSTEQASKLLEYLRPVRFEGFFGEWRAADLAYEAEMREKKMPILAA